MVLGAGFNRFGQFMSIPFLAIYLSTTSDLSNTLIGVIIACGPLAGVITGFYGGVLSDHWKRKDLLIISSVVVTIAYGLFFQLNSPIAIAVTNLVFGMASAVFEPVLMAACRDTGEKEKIQKAMILRYTSINVAAAIAPLIGGYLATSSSPKIVFLLASILSALLVVAVSMTRFNVSSKPSQAQSLVTALKAVITDRAFSLYIIAFTLVLFAYAFTTSALSLQLLEQYGSANKTTELTSIWSRYWSHQLNGPELFSILLVVNAISVLLFQGPMSYWLRRESPLNKLLKSGLVMSLGYAVLIIPLDSYHQFFLAIVVICAGESVMFPITTIVTDDITPPSQRGRYYGAAGFKKLGFVLAPPLGGYILDNFTPSILWIIACISSLLALLISIYASNLSKPQ
ncbi:MFS transporter [Aeromonas veronii]|uniref:MFS transporter n=1 Tax=Aeromonas veronii TaxID=654 RepID=UPI0015D63431|nr:MFS transporter [Aeromonas veronii]